jgi:hypothetical protein
VDGRWQRNEVLSVLVESTLKKSKGTRRKRVLELERNERENVNEKGANGSGKNDGSDAREMPKEWSQQMQDELGALP